MLWKKRTSNVEKEKAMIENGIPLLVSRLLSQREIEICDAKLFLEPEYDNISHPYEIHDMEKAVDLFIQVVLNKGAIAVIGDYDCDGVVSSAMMKELCDTMGVKCDVFLPSRLIHNYGLNPKSYEAFVSKHTDDIPDLVFLLDCGSNNYNEIKNMKEWGVKHVIVIDHHSIDSEKASTNADCFVTWHLSDKKQEMCTCGLLFQFIRGIRWKTKKVNPISFLTYAAIGTIADVSPIRGDNRIIVKNGLTGYSLNNIKSAGLHALIGSDVLKKGYLTQDDVVFKIGPRINAVGRIDHPDMAYSLLIENDLSMADKMAKHVISYNEERKTIQKKAEVETANEINEEKYPYGIFVVKKDIHIGVAGIVASRLVETFHKPTVVVGHYNGAWRGSGRSIHGVNIKAILDDCKEMFLTYGGHDKACGVSLKPEYEHNANDIFNKACKSYYDKYGFDNKPFRLYDAALNISSVNYENARMLVEKLAPYCPESNPEPIFVIRNAKIINPDINVMKKYTLMKFYVEKDGKVLDYPFISFQLGQKFGYEIQGMTMNVYFKFPQNLDSKFELMVVDAEATN